MRIGDARADLKQTIEIEQLMSEGDGLWLSFINLSD